MFLPQQYVFLDDDTGTVTPEYAVIMLAAITLAVALVLVARSESVQQSLADMVQRALTHSG